MRPPNKWFALLINFLVSALAEKFLKKNEK